MRIKSKDEIVNEGKLPPASAICLMSGGMDSCVTAAVAGKENEELAFLHVSYGQRTEQRERRAFEEIANFYKVKKRLAVSIEHLAKIGGSSLTDREIEVAEADRQGAGRYHLRLQRRQLA